MVWGYFKIVKFDKIKFVFLFLYDINVSKCNIDVDIFLCDCIVCFGLYIY